GMDIEKPIADLEIEDPVRAVALDMFDMPENARALLFRLKFYDRSSDELDVLLVWRNPMKLVGGPICAQYDQGLRIDLVHRIGRVVDRFAVLLLRGLERVLP